MQALCNVRKTKDERRMIGGLAGDAGVEIRWAQNRQAGTGSKLQHTKKSMARIQNGSILSGVSGKVGGIVIKQYRTGPVASKIPDMSNVKATKKQKAKRSLFKEAVAYAQQIIRDPERKAAYKATLRRGRSVYHTAIAEYLKKQRDLF